MPIINLDYIQLIAGVKTFLSGHGMQTPSFSIEDISQIIYDPVWIHPPSYGLVLAAILKFIPNPPQMFFITNSLFIIGFYFSWWKIFKMGGKTIPDESKLAIWTIWAFIVDPLSKLQPSGLLAISFFSIGLMFTMMAIKNSQPKLIPTLLAGISFGMCIANRFFYWPLVWIMPIIVILIGIVYKRNTIKLGISISLLIGIFWISSIYLYKAFLGKFSVTEVYPKGFFWGQLTEFYPFPLDAIGLYQTLETLIQNSFFLRGALLISLLTIISIYIVRESLLIKNLFVKENISDPIQYSFIKLTGIAVVTTIFAMTFYLTLRYKFPVICGSESRYFALTCPFILLGCIEFFRLKKFDGFTWFKSLKILLMLFLMVSAIQLYMRPRNIILKRSHLGPNYQSQMENTEENLIQIFDSIQSPHPLFFLDGPWINNYSRMMYARYMGIPSHFVFPDQFNPYTSKPITLLYAFPQNKTALGFRQIENFSKDVGGINIGEDGPVNIMRSDVNSEILKKWGPKR